MTERWWMVAGSKVIRQLPLYTPLEVLGSRSNYFQVKDADGRTGYVHQSLTGKTPSVIVTASISNVRSGPGTEFPVVFKAVRGNCYKTVAKQQEWVQITTEAGQTGWIWQNLVWGTE
ncbi:MAG: SH3 domain-containing protein [Deltaproteobacteria bacterium]|nr:SH3 domain-containing protein [Deltaproteobacteria bacterium]